MNLGQLQATQGGLEGFAKKVGRGRTGARILFVHPDVYMFGGGEQVCVRMIAAAQRIGEVTLVHCGGALDCERIWKWSRVALDPGQVRFVTAGSIGRIVGRSGQKPILKYALALRHARQIVSQFDLLVGTFGECPVAARAGVQYIHHPVFCDTADVLRYLNVGHEGFLQARLRPLYVRASRWLSGWDLKEVSRKSTLVNSLWTRAVVQQVYGISALLASPDTEVTLRPGGRGWIDWIHREMGFAMLGRIHPGKRIELGIQIIQALRQSGYDVHLHIAGRATDGYGKKIQRLIEGMSYVHFHPDLPRPELEELIVRQKFGLHACEYEHYGMAAAEMQALGCVVFAPDSSGQREVVINAAQRFTDVDDAVRKISKLLDDPDQCARLSLESTRRLNRGYSQSFDEQVANIFQKALAT